MSQELQLTFSLQWFLLKQNQQTAGTIYHRNNPSQTNASVSSNEEDGPLWRTGRSPQNVDLNQWPTEAGSVLFRLVILSSPKGKEPLLSTNPKFTRANTQRIRTPGPVFSFIFSPQHKSILGDTPDRRDFFLDFSHLRFKISPFLVWLFPILQVIVMQITIMQGISKASTPF